MALSKSWKKEVNGFGEVTLNNAYCKISSFNGSKEQIIFMVSIQNKESENIFDQQIYTFVPSMSDSNFIAQAYEYLKSLPEFANATDC